MEKRSVVLITFAFLVTQAKCGDVICQIPNDPGPCAKFTHFVPFFYIRNLRACQPFPFTGCDESRRNFSSTFKECMDNCFMDEICSEKFRETDFPISPCNISECQHDDTICYNDYCSNKPRWFFPDGTELSEAECSQRCGVNEVYSPCGAGCQFNCDDHLNPKGPAPCESLCLPGCICKQGYVRNGSAICITEDNCHGPPDSDDSPTSKPVRKPGACVRVRMVRESSPEALEIECSSECRTDFDCSGSLKCCPNHNGCFGCQPPVG